MFSCLVPLQHSVLLKVVMHHHLLLFRAGKKYTRKKLSDEQSKNDAAQPKQPKVIGTDGPQGTVESSLSPATPLLQPKTEPEEQDSK